MKVRKLDRRKTDPRYQRVEWVLDYYAPFPQTTTTNYAKVDAGSARGQRGGSWLHPASLLPAWYRNYGDPSNRHKTSGFRCAR